ncbi:MAG TPA: HlyD family secretion protein [Aliidongia sp.]|nr:HlyD family secretion protein [Aliidongia sp.]
MLTRLTPALLLIGRVLVTLAFVAGAAFAGRWLWIHYEIEPWTRDGRVRADFAVIAPDVSGFITEVRVHDNQYVRVGDTLFVIDRARYELAVGQAQANIDNQKAQLDEAERENRRNIALGNLATTEAREQSAAKIEELRAGLELAKNALDLARLNLVRTEVKATVNGVVDDLNLRPGDYFTAGRAALTLVDENSLYVVGYFEETKLPRIQLGDPARVQLMGEERILKGHVESIAPAIEDRERTPDANLLPNINPTFNWVRLAQRIPVRIAIDESPEDVLLIMGRTATVEILPPARADAKK